jgi:diadenosine tetraphosphate (Ap4A) HIT family hydrolase
MNPWQLDPQLASDSHPVARTALCEIRLMDDANYPWLIVIPRVDGARELFDLDAAQRTQLIEDVTLAGTALNALFTPDKLNVAALGNLVPQLHVHVVARHVDDPAWPAPVWGRVQAQPYSPEALTARMRLLLSRIGG